MKSWLVPAMVLSLLIGLASPALATSLSALPPPPPPPPGCNVCAGPPPPPTPVPTLAQTAVAPQPVVDIKLGADHVSRGHLVRLNVDASTDDEVTVVVHYRKGKPVTYRARVGSDGTATRSWKIPPTALIGKVVIDVTVQGPVDRYARTLSFTVTR